MRLSLMRAVAALLLLPGASVAGSTGPAVAAPVPGVLAPYNVSGVYSAGVSSGGYMATQLHVAYSSTFQGSAVFASGPYYCARNQLSVALFACMDTMQNLQLDTLVRTTRDWSAQGRIDDVANLSGDPVYVLGGSNDSTVKRPVVDALTAYYRNFGANVLANMSTAAGHAWVSPLGPNSCTVTARPWVNDCGIDPERALLGHLLGAVNPPAGSLGGTLTRFDQNAYAPGGQAKPISMDDTGFVYVPTRCAGGHGCRLFVALHGCKQGYSYQGFGTTFVDKAYLNEYADTNDLIVLYPQAIATTTLDNPNGCWNWWGYQGDAEYAQHGGEQIETIMAMVRALTGDAPPAPQDRVSLASVDAQDGYLKAAADGSGATVGTLEDSYGQAVGRGTDGRFNRTMLSFDTSRIPAGAEITRAYVTVSRSSGSGDPWSSPPGNRLLLDVHNGCLGGCDVESTDWSAAATAPGAAELASGGMASTDLSAAGVAAINRSGTTQMRLRFAQNQTATAYAFLNKDTQATLTVEYR